jgi:hypothetical protein
LTLMNELDKFTPAAPVPHTTQLPKKKGGSMVQGWYLLSVFDSGRNAGCSEFGSAFTVQHEYPAKSSWFGTLDGVATGKAKPFFVHVAAGLLVRERAKRVSDTHHVVASDQ